MDFELKNKLKNYRNKIYEYLFSDTDINKWENNEKVFINKNFIPLLQGDWTRNYYGYQGINLGKILNKKISKTELFNILKDELSRTISFKDNDYYIHNFNPNLFFLLYDQFYDCEIKNNKITWEAYCAADDKIIGIFFCEETRKVLREETVYLIELHSMFVLNSNIFDILENNLYTDIFIKNCYIQYHAKKYGNLTKNRFIDLSYVINNKPYFIEINEKAHSKILDYYKEIDVYLTTGSRLNSMDLYDEFYSTAKTFRKFLHNFCISLYKAGYKDQSITLHMVEFSDFSVDTAKIGVQLVNKTLEIKLADVLALPFFDESNDQIETDDLIIKLYNLNKINPEKDFSNWCEIIPDYESTKGLKPNNILIMCAEKENIILNTKGLMKILTNIPTNMWSRQDDYFEYLDNLQTKYVETVSRLLDDELKDIKIVDRYIEYKNIVELIKFDQDEYFKNIKEKVGNRRLTNLFHDKLPFLKVDNRPNKFVDFTVYKNLVNQKYLNTLSGYHIKKIDKNNLEKAELILGYSIMSSDEIKEIYSMTSKQFDEKYYNHSNDTILFID